MTVERVDKSLTRARAARREYTKNLTVRARERGSQLQDSGYRRYCHQCLFCCQFPRGSKEGSLHHQSLAQITNE